MRTWLMFALDPSWAMLSGVADFEFASLLSPFRLSSGDFGRGLMSFETQLCDVGQLFSQFGKFGATGEIVTVAAELAQI